MPAKPCAVSRRKVQKKFAVRASDRRKQSVYFPEGHLAQIWSEAKRLDRSFSWILQHAWEVARGRIAKVQGPG